MTTPIKKLIPRLCIVDDDTPALVDDTSGGLNLLGFLEEPGAEFTVRRIGHEVRIGRRPVDQGAIDVTRGDSQLVPGGGHVASGRYLMREAGAGGRILGALAYTVQSKSSGRQSAVVTTVVVDPAARRQGVATRLLEELMEDHPGGRVVPGMTADGGAFFGYTPVAAPTAAPVAPARRRA
tara:strand:+ start:1557 stop:2096 length:540 start_codon:yes stop_codon:yes gene_type:complete